MDTLAVPVTTAPDKASGRDLQLNSVLSQRERIRTYFDMVPHDGPLLVIDLNTVRDNYRAFRASMPEAKVFYAVKANPAPDLLKMLALQGSSFDVASLPEVKMALAAGASPDRISFGNTIKKEKDIKVAYDLGIRLFAVDSVPEVKKIARAAPGSKVYCRMLCDGDGAQWPLSRKFGCEPGMAMTVLNFAHELGLVPYGISFHPGSQQGNMQMWDRALESVARVFKQLEERGVFLKLVNMGGGYPTRYDRDIPSLNAYGVFIRQSLEKHFEGRTLDLIIEPGRGMVGNAGMVRAEVVLAAHKSDEDPMRWVYLDIGKFGGLAETDGELARYPILTDREEDPKVPCILAGPTCDSADILYQKTPYPLPTTLTEGDYLYIEAAGAYTTTYATNGFNGFEPLRAVCLAAE